MRCVAHRERRNNDRRPVGNHRLSSAARHHRQGSAATTSYGLGRKVAILVNSVTSFSDRPLIWIFYLGVAIGTIAALAATYLVIQPAVFRRGAARLAVTGSCRSGCSAA